MANINNKIENSNIEAMQVKLIRKNNGIYDLVNVDCTRLIKRFSGFGYTSEDVNPNQYCQNRGLDVVDYGIKDKTTNMRLVWGKKDKWGLVKAYQAKQKSRQTA